MEPTTFKWWPLKGYISSLVTLSPKRLSRERSSVPWVKHHLKTGKPDDPVNGMTSSLKPVDPKDPAMTPKVYTMATLQVLCDISKGIPTKARPNKFMRR